MLQIKAALPNNLNADKDDIIDMRNNNRNRSKSYVENFDDSFAGLLLIFEPQDYYVQISIWSLLHGSVLVYFL